MKSYAYGFPRLGANREFKKCIEGYWRDETTEEQLWKALFAIQSRNNDLYHSHVHQAPQGEMTLYDPMLDAAILCGLFSPDTLDDYYTLCRGSSALEMTKWFNTNYHYLVADFSALDNVSFKLNADHFALRFKQCACSLFIGPFTFLKLSKGIAGERFNNLFFELIEVYRELLTHYEHVQIDEPAFVMDLNADEIAMIGKGYERLSSTGCNITLMTYYDDVDWMAELLQLPVHAIGLDFVRGKKSFEFISKHGFPDDKILIAGLVDGRNVWKNNIAESVNKARLLNDKKITLAVSNAAPLYHLPYSVKHEKSMRPQLKARLAFAVEKLEEIQCIVDVMNGAELPSQAIADNYGFNPDVRKRVSMLNEQDFIKPVGLEDRRQLHDESFKLPLFPTTTIGSFPQTTDVRKHRAAYRKGTLSKEAYRQFIQSEIDKLIKVQEDLGLDVFVHGEFERTDMVEFFAQCLEGIATTMHGWIISYGTRTYRPPIIFGDVYRASPMTIDEIRYAQSKTTKLVKGMLTGAVTIIAWSFCREDIAVADVAYQIGLGLKDEIRDYEEAGIQIVQVDEAAFREKAPIKKRDWPIYFDWAVKSFNLTTNTETTTQIHTHMCYSEFGEIIDYINKMDFDVISIEASRSRGDIIAYFETIDFKKQIGLGVWDIHSPVVPSVDQMKDIVQRSLPRIPKENFWINPDCGLKTRDWPESIDALKNLVEAAEQLRVEEPIFTGWK